MLSDYIEERYGTVIRNYKEQHQKDQEEIKKYKKMLRDHGIKVDEKDS